MSADFDRIRGLVVLMNAARPDHRLDVLKFAVTNYGGRWDLPSERIGEYQPAIVEIQVFGIHAMAEDVDQLAEAWLTAARDMLEAAERETQNSEGA